MLKLTKTGIGLLTRQYRSVLKKCWAINVGIFALGAVAATVMATTILPSDAYADETGGTGNIASGATSSAFGYYNRVQTIYASAFGIWNIASGSTSSAFGYQNTASGYYSSAFGVNSQSYGQGSSAFGYNAQAGDSSDDTVTNYVTTNSKERYATAVGAYVQATGLYALALGNQKSGMTKTMASGESAIAIGTGAQATHDNSVAIGTNSVSAGENTISVGSSSIQRQIKYVAAGTDDTDAVNLKQLNDAIAGVSGGGSSVTLDTTFDAESTNGATSQAIANYLDNNYYRKNKKSEILNGFEEGKIGNEIGDFSKLTANDNFATVENKAA